MTFPEDGELLTGKYGEKYKFLRGDSNICICYMSKSAGKNLKRFCRGHNLDRTAHPNHPDIKYREAYYDRCTCIGSCGGKDEESGRFLHCMCCELSRDYSGS